MIIGIQGAMGSFNEKACKKFCLKRGITGHKIAYLVSTENVLREISAGTVQLGIFAVSSSRQGFVEETEKAMKKYGGKFEKIDELTISIEHVLLGLKKLARGEYERIVSHPQALKEHGLFLKKAFPNAELLGAEDTALPARLLKEGHFGSKTLVLATKECAELYGLEIVEKNLPLNKGYFATFYLVRKKQGQ